jgi:hypothetical protein
MPSFRPRELRLRFLLVCVPFVLIEYLGLSGAQGDPELQPINC